jgi:1-acyl-sn-glycerol-3-phosphate acyltransferase
VFGLPQDGQAGLEKRMTRRWTPIVQCLPGPCLTDTPPQVTTIVRLARRNAVGLVFSLGAPLIPLVQRWLPRYQGGLLNVWLRAILAAAGVRVRLRDPDRSRGAGGELVVSNHVSWMDILVLGLARHGRFVGTVKDAPATLEALGKRLHGVPFNRDRPETLLATLAGLTGILRSGERVIAFPESTTYCGVHVGRFHPALFQTAIDAGAPVQPARLRYVLADGTPTSAAAFLGDEQFAVSLDRVLRTRGLTVELTLRPLIPAGVAENRRVLAQLAHNSVFDPIGEKCLS